ncbi:MAG: hypothetical protein K2X27_21660 [Candidatus Obscuribacterales bacterium]|nr:hypothetical protein [Candidatus Obscuribacterales bacterium]
MVLAGKPDGSNIVNEVHGSKSSQEPKLTLKPARIDFRSAKVQMVFAALAVFGVCFISMSPTLGAGFLLDDFLHLDYVSKAFHGNWDSFLFNFYGNWANSPIMKSYRPLVSLSILTDFAVWGANSWGYHLSNLLLYWGSCVLVGLISMELTGMRGNKLGAAASFWAALLFAVYPLHLEASAWIIGRVDLLCTLFYLTSIFAYFRYRLLREKFYFKLSLLAFLAALLSKEMAVTLPIVIAAAELLLAPFWDDKSAPELSKQKRSQRITAVLSYWYLLGLFATWRTFCLGTLFGGYGSGGLHALQNFLNKESIDKILFPLNLDLLSRTGEWDLKEALLRILKGAYLSILGIGAFRLLIQSASKRILLFLLIWLLASVLPTYQIWLISPNLVGSRLFFLASAPFAILLSFLALPAIDIVSSKITRILSVAGCLALLTLSSIWSYWLNFDMQAWLVAGASMRKFQEELISKLKELKPEHSILLLSLPTDYSGAGMLTRGQYLKFLLQAPNTKEDLSSKVMTLEPPDTASPVEASNYNYSKALSAALQNPKIDKVYTWNDATSRKEAGSFAIWKKPSAETKALAFALSDENCRFVPDAEGSDFQKLDADKAEKPRLANLKEWTLEKDGGRTFQLSETGALRVRPGTSGLTVLFPEQAISPRELQKLILDCKCIAGTAPILNICWFTEGAKKLSAVPIQLNNNRLETNLGLYKSWAYAPLVKQLAIHLPGGDYELELSRIELQN